MLANRHISAVLLGALLALGPVAASFGHGVTPSIEAVKPSALQAPFRIDSDLDFDASHGVSGGDGTPGNPWRISNLTVDGSGGTCIFIGNTTDSFVVSGCRLFNATGSSGLSWPVGVQAGIALLNVTNGKLSGNNVSGCRYGIYLANSSGNSILENQISSASECSVQLSGSDSNLITSNVISGQTTGIGLDRLSSVTNGDRNTSYASLLSYPNDLTIYDGRAYIASFQSNSLTVFDVSDPSAPAYLGGVAGAGAPIYLRGAHDVKVQDVPGVGRVAYVLTMYYLGMGPSNGDNSLVIFDVTDPANIAMIGLFTDPTNMSNPFSLEVDGPYAYVACQGLSVMGGALAIVDVSDPYKPHMASSTSFTSDHISAGLYVIKEGDTVYVSSRYEPYNGVSVYDVSNVSDIRFLGGSYGHGGSDGVWTFGKQGDYLFCPELANDTVEVLNVSDPSSISLVNTISHPGFTQCHVAAPSGNELYVVWVCPSATSAASGAVGVYDISNISDIREITTITQSVDPSRLINLPHAMKLWNGTAFVVSKGSDSMSAFRLGARPAMGLRSSSGNTIFHNWFKDNPVHAGDDGANAWDAGCRAGGNCWSGYTGADALSGPGQNLPGSDGIGDTPVAIASGTSFDRYPLMLPWDSPKPSSWFRVKVQQGWNLVSVPLTQKRLPLPSGLLDSDGDTEWDRAMWYDGAAKRWRQYNSAWPDALDALWSFDNRMAVWLNVTVLGDGYINVSGEMPGSSTILLRAGWNMVGYPSLSANATVCVAFWGTGADIVEVFDANATYKTRVVGPTYVMKPGEGYWVHVPADTIWTVDW